MTVDRSTWPFEFTRFDSLPWRCPGCGVAALRIKEGSLSEGETAASKRSHSELAFEPEWIDGRFSCMFECGQCSGEIGVIGTFQVRDERGYDNGEEVGDYTNYYKPMCFTDSPHIIDIPNGVPADVANEITTSFQLFWSEPLACANRIRSSVEELLTAQRVNRSTGGPRTGKPRRMLRLHARIELFAKKNKELAEQLMAIKWIGNAGSHADIVTHRDLLDAYDILCFVLDELYVARGKRIGALARRINKRSAPLSKRRVSKR